MIELSPHAQSILDWFIETWEGYRNPDEYGATAFQNWYYQIKDAVYSLDEDDGEYGVYKTFPLKYWGEIEFVRYKINDDIYTRILNFNFQYRNIINWITRFRYPRRRIHSSTTSPTVGSYLQVEPPRSLKLPNGVQVYAVQSDTHLYSLADKNNKLVLNKWFDSLNFPINQTVGNLHIIGYGTINKIPYYIDDNLQLHHGAEIAHLQKPKIEGKQYKKNVIRLTESQFHKMLVECISKIMKKIV